MRITKRQLRRIIKEEKARILRETSNWKPLTRTHADELGDPNQPSQSGNPPETEWAVRDDIKDAIQMLENEEDPNGVLFYVIERLHTALEKIQ